MRVRFENGVEACMNPRGYPDEIESGYSREAIIEVPLDGTPGNEGAAADGPYLDRMAEAHANSALSGFVSIEDDVVFV
jgi:hypothetical protein